MNAQTYKTTLRVMSRFWDGVLVLVATLLGRSEGLGVCGPGVREESLGVDVVLWRCWGQQ